MFVRKVYNWLQNNLNITIHCLLCRESTLWRDPICSRCMDEFPNVTHSCHCCGSLDLALDISLCHACQVHKPHFDVCISAYRYDYPVSNAIKMIKYQKRLELIPPIISPLIQTLEDHYWDQPWPQVLIPLPLHKKRLRERGYDQSALLGQALVNQLDSNHSITLNDQLLKRTRHTDSQQTLSAKQRKRNIKDAFAVGGTLHYEHIALIDDVVTSGATVSEAAKILKKAGANKVDVWTLARTPAPDR